MATAERILEEALQLPEDERATLVASLVDSLSAPDPTDGMSNQEWLAEIERRAREAFKTPGIPWEQVEAHAREHLGSMRSR